MNQLGQWVSETFRGYVLGLLRAREGRPSRRTTAKKHARPALAAEWIGVEPLEPRVLMSDTQIVTPTVTDFNVVPNTAIQFDVNYTTNDPVDNTLTGLTLRMHFDSSALSIDVSDITNQLMVGGPTLQVQPDSSDLDGDPSTDMFVNAFWFDLFGNWPNVALPTRLYTAMFTPVTDYEGMTTINFTALPDGTQSFSSTPISVNIDGTGPTIDATVPDFDVTQGNPVSSIQLFFTDQSDLDESTVTDVNNYTLFASGGDQVFGNGNDVDLSSRLTSVTYDSMTKVATLNLSQALDPADFGLEFEDFKATANGTTGNFIRDIVGNALDDGMDSSGVLTIDTRGPVPDITDVTPDPRNGSINSIDVVFSQVVDGVVIGDFTLTRDGGADLIGGSGASVSSSDGITWTVTGLSGLTGAEGAYVFSIDATGSSITSQLNGLAPVSNASDTFVVDTTGPVASLASPTESTVNAFTGNQLLVDFVEAVGLNTSTVQTTGNYTLIGAGPDDDFGTTGDNTAHTISSAVLAGGQVTLTLSSSPLPDGMYRLTVGTGIQDTATNPLNGNSAQMFEFAVDNTGPTAMITPVAPDPRNTAVDTIFFSFDEAVSGLSLADVSLWRNGSSVSLAGATLNDLGGNNYSVSGLTTATTPDGDYSFIVHAAGITDLVGNVVAADVNDDFSVDMTGPTVTGSTPADMSIGGSTITTITVTFDDVTGLDETSFETIGNYTILAAGADGDFSNGGEIDLSGNIQSVVLNGSTVTITLSPGLDPESQAGMPEFDDYRLTISSGELTDTLGNPLNDGADEVIEFRIDTRGPVPNITDITPDPRNSPVSSATITFSQPVNNFDLSEVTLTRDGGADLISGSGASLSTSDSGTTWLLSGLSGLTGAEGTYTLTVNTGDITSQINGLPAVASANDVWIMDLTSPIADLTTPAAGSAVQGPVTQLIVSYTEANGMDPASSQSTSNYTLRSAGGNMMLGDGDDVVQTINSAVLAGNDVTLTLPGALADGLYRLTVTGTETVTDAAGNAINGGADQSFDFEVDSTVPTADITNVSPDPRNTPVNTIGIVFDDTVTGLDLADLTLTRDGGGNLLTGGESLTSSDGGVTWTLSGLSGITGIAGTYTLTLTAAASGIVDNAGNAMVSNATDSWTNTQPTIDTQTTTDNTPTITGTLVDTSATLSVTFTGEPLDVGGPSRTVATFTATNNGNGTWTLNTPSDVPDGRYDLSLTITDTMGNQSTYNPAGFELTITDPFEADDTSGTAGTIPADGTSQLHSLHVMADEDWTAFSIAETLDMVITVAPNTSQDMRVELYEADGMTSLAGSVGAGEREINIQLNAGTYLVRVVGSGNTNVVTEYELTVASDPDLVIALADQDLVAAIINGQVGVDISNLKNVTVDGGTMVTTSIIASIDDIVGNGDDILVGSSLVNVGGLNANNSPLSASVSVNPTTLAAGVRYNIFAQVDSNNVLVELDETNNNSDPVAITAPIRFGDGIARTVYYTQPDGTLVRVDLVGGIGFASIAGDDVEVTTPRNNIFVITGSDGVMLDQLLIDPTTRNGQLGIRTGRGGVAVIHDVHITDDFSTFNAPTTRLNGDFDADGGLRMLRLGDVGGGGQQEINIGVDPSNPTQYTDFYAGIINDLTLNASRLGTVRATTWLDSPSEGSTPDAINADVLRRLLITGFSRATGGHFGAGMNLGGADGVDYTLGTAFIRGDIDLATWDIEGNVQGIRAGNLNEFELNVDGDVMSLIGGAATGSTLDISGWLRRGVVQSWLSGGIDVGGVQLLSVTGGRGVRGDFADSWLNVNGLAGVLTPLGAVLIADDLTDAEFDVDGHAGRIINRGGVDDFDLYVDGNLSLLQLGGIDYADVEVDGLLSLARAVAWNSGSLTAYELGSLITSGDFGADVWVTDPSGMYALNNAVIGGFVLGGEWHFDGGVRSISVGGAGSEDSWSVVIDGVLGQLASADYVWGLDLTADRAERLIFNDDVEDSSINLLSGPGAAAPTLGSFVVRNRLDSTDVRSWGNIGQASIGFMQNSNLFAGVNDEVDGLPDEGDFDAMADIRRLNIGGFTESNIGAYSIGQANLGDVDPDNEGTPFGVATTSFGRIDYRVGGERMSLRTVADAMVANFDDDFMVRIV